MSLILEPSLATPDWRGSWGRQLTRGGQPQFTAVPASDVISGSGRHIYRSVHTQRGLPNACLFADRTVCMATSHLLQRFLLHLQDFFSENPSKPSGVRSEDLTPLGNPARLD